MKINSRDRNTPLYACALFQDSKSHDKPWILLVFSDKNSIVNMLTRTYHVLEESPILNFFVTISNFSQVKEEDEGPSPPLSCNCSAEKLTEAEAEENSLV